MCSFYNKNGDDVYVTFPPLEEMNRTVTADYIVKLRGSDLMSDEMGIQYAYPELSEAEKQTEVARVKELRELKKEKENKEELDKEEKIDKEVVMEDESENTESDNNLDE